MAKANGQVEHPGPPLLVSEALPGQSSVLQNPAFIPLAWAPLNYQTRRSGYVGDAIHGMRASNGVQYRFYSDQTRHSFLG